MTDTFDAIIVGGGPAGLAAGLYAARDRYRTLILEKNGLPGGQIMLTERIENYPGYEKVTGPGLGLPESEIRNPQSEMGRSQTPPSEQDPNDRYPL